MKINFYFFIIKIKRFRCLRLLRCATLTFCGRRKATRGRTAKVKPTSNRPANQRSVIKLIQGILPTLPTPVPKSLRAFCNERTKCLTFCSRHTTYAHFDLHSATRLRFLYDLQKPNSFDNSLKNFNSSITALFA